MYTGTEIEINDFSGGHASNIARTNHTTKQAEDSQNIVIFPFGRGFRQRYGNTEFNSSAMNGGANLQGLSYYKLTNADEFLVAVCGNALFRSTSTLGGTMTDITGALTITGGQNNIWTHLTFNDVHLGFGGPATSPNAPWAWTGSGNAAALGGSPPSAYGAFHVNNRVFAFRTSANPSRILWTIVGNQANWTGSGSGNADVWTSDNDSLTAAAILNTNTVLLFKENSVHQMIVSNLISNAFPIFPLFKDVGCVGKHAVVVADGLCYFINSQGRMKITDGARIFTEKDFTALNDADDLWAGLNASRLQYMQGKRIIGADYDHILWICSASAASTNNQAIIWDLKNQCWLKHPTGFKCNVLTTTQAGVPYTGHYNGKIYKQDVSSAITDASESNAAIDAYWTSGWLRRNSLERITQPRRINVSYETQTTGQIRLSYGFDFNAFAQTMTFSQAAPGGTYDVDFYDGTAVYSGQDDLISNNRIVGRGNVFQYRLRNDTSGNFMKINSLTVSGKEAGQKVVTAR